MPNPWEKYAAPVPEATAGPWAKYGAPPPASPPADTSPRTLKEALSLPEIAYPGGEHALEETPEALGQYIQQGPKTMGSGIMDVAHGDIARGGHKIISGAGVTAIPALPLALTNPAMALRALIGGAAGSKIGSTGAEALGANPEQQEFAGDVGNVFGGFTAASGLTRALLQSPAKALMETHADSLLKILQPRKALIDYLQGKIKETVVGKPTPEAPTPAATAVPKAAPAGGVPNMEIYKEPIVEKPTAPSKTPLLDELQRWDRVKQIHQAMDQQIGAGQNEVLQWMEAHNQGAAGGKQPADILKAAATSSPFQEAPTPTFTLATKGGTPVNDVLMKVDPAKLDAAWPKDNYYIRPGGASKSSSLAAYTRAQTDVLGKEPITAPRVTVDAKGQVDFTDGRNHFAALRDQGVSEVQVSVPPDQVAAFEKHLGAVRAQPETPSSMEGYYGKNAGKSNNFGKTGKPTAQFKRDFPGGIVPAVPARPTPSWSFAVDPTKLAGYKGKLGEMK